MELRKVGENQSGTKVNFEYDKGPAGTEGYLYYKDGARIARTFDPNDLTVTFGKPFETVKVEAVRFSALDADSWPDAAPPTEPTIPEPPAIAGKGYKLVFEDDFTEGLDIGDNNKWYPGEFWNRAPAGSIYLNAAKNMVVSSRKSDGYPVVCVTTLKKDISKARVFNEPVYAESRFRWTVGPGSWPGFWFFSHQHAMGGSGYTSEFDIFEGQGTTPKEFSGALHRDTSGSYEEFKGCWTKPPGQPNLNEWHVFAGWWLKDKVVWYVDNNKLCEQPTYPETDQPMYMLYSMWIGGWAAGNVIGPSTPDSLDIEVDWVNVWSLNA